MIPGVEIKFVPLPGAAADAKGGIIYLKGGPVCTGYWNLPEDSAKSFSDDGWFNTGDIGHLDEDDCLVITGRAKRLFKTEGGKYVAPEKVEKAF
jgi:long-chain acyl-CoA synthetase